jgi:hypothetical protein
MWGSCQAFRALLRHEYCFASPQGCVKQTVLKVTAYCTARQPFVPRVCSPLSSEGLSRLLVTVASQTVFSFISWCCLRIAVELRGSKCNRPKSHYIRYVPFIIQRIRRPFYLSPPFCSALSSLRADSFIEGLIGTTISKPGSDTEQEIVYGWSESWAACHNQYETRVDRLCFRNALFENLHSCLFLMVTFCITVKINIFVSLVLFPWDPF